MDCGQQRAQMPYQEDTKQYRSRRKAGCFQRGGAELSASTRWSRCCRLPGPACLQMGCQWVGSQEASRGSRAGRAVPSPYVPCYPQPRRQVLAGGGSAAEMLWALRLDFVTTSLISCGASQPWETYGLISLPGWVNTPLPDGARKHGGTCN